MFQKVGVPGKLPEKGELSDSYLRISIRLFRANPSGRTADGLAPKRVFRYEHRRRSPPRGM